MLRLLMTLLVLATSQARVGGTSVLGDAVSWKLRNPSGASLRNVLACGLSIGRVPLGAKP